VGGQTIGKCTGISVRYEGGPVDVYGGGYPEPLEIFLGNRSTTISVDYVEWSVEDVDQILTDSYVDVELLGSEYDLNRGLSGMTLTRCKAVTWELTSTQDGVVTYRLELRKAKAAS